VFFYVKKWKKSQRIYRSRSF